MNASSLGDQEVPLVGGEDDDGSLARMERRSADDESSDNSNSTSSRNKKKKPPLPQLLHIPDWFEEENDNVNENESDSDSDSVMEEERQRLWRFRFSGCDGNTTTTATTNNSSDDKNKVVQVLLEKLLSADDVSATILSHLSLDEISDCSVVSKTFYSACRSNALWKRLFAQRWNVPTSTSTTYDSSTSTTTTTGNNNDDDAQRHFFTCYQQAHCHPHDLWITHWNCVYPCEGLTPGRCCIQQRRQRQQRHASSSSSSTQPSITGKQQQSPNDGVCCCRCSCGTCPHCRLLLTTMDDDDETTHCCCSCTTSSSSSSSRPRTEAQAMAHATRMCQERLNNIPFFPPPPCSSSSSSERRRRSQRAFARAATFHRRLCTQQYEQHYHQQSSSPTNFLTDLLFFNLTDPASSDGQWELQQLLRETTTWTTTTTVGGGTADADDDDDKSLLMMLAHETTHHSWHVCKLFNPDFYRPLMYEMGVSRPECFTVYPSQGYIEPGESVYVTVGIRPLGSAMAYAFEALNIFREHGHLDDTTTAAASSWSELYTEEAHLPMAPILIRYWFTTTQPVSTSISMNDVDRNNVDGPAIETTPVRRPPTANGAIGSSSKVKSAKQAVLDFHRKRHVPPHQMRTIYLSVHVNAHYKFSDFLAATCHPWNSATIGSANNGSDDYGPIFSSPILREEHPAIFQRLENVYRPAVVPDLVGINPHHTEGPCRRCRTTWGSREEEFAQAYVIARTESMQSQQRRQRLLQNIVQCIRLTQKGISGDPAHLSSLFYVMSCIVQSYKGSPWTSLRQKRSLVYLEAIIDNIYPQIPVGGKEWVPWRTSGVYRTAVCTDSVFGRRVVNLEDSAISESLGVEWKDEPRYLDAFRHLAHSPGLYCLGPQEDPNHLEETVVLHHNAPRYHRSQKGCATDLFMDHPISAFQAGICMIRDPRSLLVHGIFDMIRYPGAVVRRPKVDLPTTTMPLMFENIILCSDRLTYCYLQNALDLQCILAQYSTRFTPSNDVGSLFTIANEQWLTNYSLYCYCQGIPPPGVGRFPLSRRAPWLTCGRSGVGAIAPLKLAVSAEFVSSQHNDEETQNRNAPQPHDVRAANARPPRFLHLLWILGAQVGLVVRDSHDASSVFVERNILIASQWVTVSFMAAPIFVTLFARYIEAIPTEPVDYQLHDLPFTVSTEMRFMTPTECGYVAALIFLMWLTLARWTERNTYRDFFRVMLDHILTDKLEKQSFLRRVIWRISVGFQRVYDVICPLFLQRRVFAPSWNLRSREDLIRHIAHWRSRNLVEQQSVVSVKTIKLDDNAVFGDCRDKGIDVRGNSNVRKILIGFVTAIGSFCSSSPHFWLNLVTVFSCSISLGMSVSLHSIEKGRSFGATESTGSMLQSFSVVTIVILTFLLGQLVGSSGGTMFLAEFVVTSVSLLLGGAGTISASAMESWGCFFCLSSTAFWGYLFGRVALMDGILQKRGGYSSVLLSKAVIFLVVFWILVFFVAEFDTPVSLFIVEPKLDSKFGRASWNRKYLARKLQ